MNTRSKMYAMKGHYLSCINDSYRSLLTYYDKPPATRDISWPLNRGKQTFRNLDNVQSNRRESYCENQAEENRVQSIPLHV